MENLQNDQLKQLVMENALVDYKMHVAQAKLKCKRDEHAAIQTQLSQNAKLLTVYESSLDSLKMRVVAAHEQIEGNRREKETLLKLHMSLCQQFRTVRERNQCITQGRESMIQFYKNRLQDYKKKYKSLPWVMNFEQMKIMVMKENINAAITKKQYSSINKKISLYEEIKAMREQKAIINFVQEVIQERNNLSLLESLKEELRSASKELKALEEKKQQFLQQHSERILQQSKRSRGIFSVYSFKSLDKNVKHEKEKYMSSVKVPVSLRNFMSGSAVSTTFLSQPVLPKKHPLALTSTHSQPSPLRREVKRIKLSGEESTDNNLSQDIFNTQGPYGNDNSNNTVNNTQFQDKSVDRNSKFNESTINIQNVGTNNMILQKLDSVSNQMSEEPSILSNEQHGTGKRKEDTSHGQPGKHFMSQNRRENKADSENQDSSLILQPPYANTKPKSVLKSSNTPQKVVTISNQVTILGQEDSPDKENHSFRNNALITMKSSSPFQPQRGLTKHTGLDAADSKNYQGQSECEYPEAAGIELPEKAVKPHSHTPPPLTAHFNPFRSPALSSDMFVNSAPSNSSSKVLRQKSPYLEPESPVAPKKAQVDLNLKSKEVQLQQQEFMKIPTSQMMPAKEQKTVSQTNPSKLLTSISPQVKEKKTTMENLPQPQSNITSTIKGATGSTLNTTNWQKPRGTSAQFEKPNNEEMAAPSSMKNANDKMPDPEVFHLSPILSDRSVKTASSPLLGELETPHISSTHSLSPIFEGNNFSSFQTSGGGGFGESNFFGFNLSSSLNTSSTDSFFNFFD